MLLRDFFEAIYRPRRLPSGRPATLHHYRIFCTLFSDWLGRAATTDDLTNDLVAGFLAHYAEGRSPYSVDTARNALMALWRCARLRGESPEPPDLLPPRLPETHPVAWSPADLQRLVAAAACWEPGRVERTAYPIPPSLWWVAFCLVAYDSGFRAGALLALAWSDLSRCSATARAGSQKTWRDETRALAADTIVALDAIREPERTLVFEFRATTATYYRHWDAILRLAGLPGGPKHKTQCLRRTSATAVAAAFDLAAAQQHLGHESPRTTRRHYLDASQIPDINRAASIPRPTF